MAVSQFVTTTGILLEGVMILNGVVDINGTANGLVLDSDADTHISAPTNNQIDIAVGGADDFTITSNSFNTLTGSCMAGPSSTFVPFIPIAGFQSLSGAGAISVATYFTAVTSTGVNALTMSDGVVKGQLKEIQMIIDGGDATITPANLSGATTITLADVGDNVLLVWDGTDWVVIRSTNNSDGVTAPAIA